MLVLTRRPGEQIVIGNGIRVTVVSVGPGRVKLGIEAPADVRIDRQEIHEKIQHEQAELGADVLATVGRPAEADSVSPTIVTSASGDTSTRLPIRLPEPVAAATPVPLSRLLSQRLPRKPR